MGLQDLLDLIGKDYSLKERRLLALTKPSWRRLAVGRILYSA
jgi:hypothetical protein